MATKGILHPNDRQSYFPETLPPLKLLGADSNGMYLAKILYSSSCFICYNERISKK